MTDSALFSPIGLRSLQFDIESSDIKLSPISLLTDFGVYATYVETLSLNYSSKKISNVANNSPESLSRLFSVGQRGSWYTPSSPSCSTLG